MTLYFPVLTLPYVVDHTWQWRVKSWQPLLEMPSYDIVGPKLIKFNMGWMDRWQRWFGFENRYFGFITWHWNVLPGGSASLPNWSWDSSTHSATVCCALDCCAYSVWRLLAHLWQNVEGPHWGSKDICRCQALLHWPGSHSWSILGQLCWCSQTIEDHPWYGLHQRIQPVKRSLG